MLPKRNLLVTSAIALSILAAGCGGSATGDAVRDASDTEAAVDSFGQSTLPRIDAPTLSVPEDNEESAAWVREHLNVYEGAYEECGGYVDIDSPRFDPSQVSTARSVVTEEARSTSEQAAWVAFQGCQDGISDYPFPIPEVQYLQRNP